MKTCSETERMFQFNCGVDDENSTKQSLAKPSTIHILIPIPMLKQSDLYFKPRFLCSQVKMAHFCALISQNLHLKTTNIKWMTKSSCLGDFVVVLTFWLRLVQGMLQVRNKHAKI